MLAAVFDAGLQSHEGTARSRNVDTGHAKGTTRNLQHALGKAPLTLPQTAQGARPLRFSELTLMSQVRMVSRLAEPGPG
ncbi:MAG: hypothetical protein M3N47_11935, partial [Chloroflexota bacterium]|nr:hypothetical protein [Chloroflexota bacterium]